MHLNMKRYSIDMFIFRCFPKIIRQASFYGAASVFVALLNIAIRNILNVLFTYSTSIVLAYLVGTVFKFYISKKYIFCYTLDGKIVYIFIKYLIVSVLGLSTTYFTTIALHNFIMVNYMSGNTVIIQNISHILGLSIGFLVNFTGHKLFAFKM